MLMERHYLYRAEGHTIRALAELAADAGGTDEVALERVTDEKELLSLGVTDAEAARRYANGDLTFVARLDGRLAAILWACMTDCYIKGVGISVPCGQSGSYFYNVYVFPEFRRNKLLVKLMSVYAAYCRKMDLSEMYALVLTSNDRMNQFMDKYFCKDKTLYKISLFSIRIGLVVDHAKRTKDVFIFRDSLLNGRYWI